MSVEIFTLKQFEDALPKHKTTGQPLCICQGMVEGEFQYYMKIDEYAGITIRSSVGPSGYSADTGDDSIRAWLTDHDSNPLGSKVSRWTNRLPGWDVRLCNVLRTLWQWRKQAGDCPHCKTPLKIFKVRKAGPNKGRVFAKCDVCEQQHRPNHWTWLD